MSSGQVDYMGMFKKYTSPQAVKDFDKFLDHLPMNVGYNALIAAGMAWLLAGSAIFFTSTETEKVSKLHADLMQVEALKPPIPVLKYTPVPSATLKILSDKITATYKGISIVGATDGVTVTAADTDFFPQFLAAISYLQRGGKNWKVGINSLCVGRNCSAAKLTATLKIETVQIAAPEEEKAASGDKK